MQKSFIVIRIYKDDRFVDLPQRAIHTGYDAAWLHLCSIVESESGTTPARPRNDQPISIELRNEHVQIWACTIPEIITA